LLPFDHVGFPKTVCRAARLALLLGPFVLAATGNAAAQGAAHEGPEGVSRLPESETMFLTGLMLLALGFLARQLLKKNGPKSLN
jgi:hypothetical protein